MSIAVNAIPAPPMRRMALLTYRMVARLVRSERRARAPIARA